MTRAGGFLFAIVTILLIVTVSGCSGSSSSHTPTTVPPPRLRVEFEIRPVLGDEPRPCTEENFLHPGAAPIRGAVVVPYLSDRTSQGQPTDLFPCVRLGPPAFAAPVARLKTLLSSQGQSNVVVLNVDHTQRGALTDAMSRLKGKKVGVVILGDLVAEPIVTSIPKSGSLQMTVPGPAYQRLDSIAHDVL